MAQEGFLGEIRMFAGNFAPRSWSFCEGQLLSIAQNTALFSILGTTYGGDGRTTFALPDLRGRGPIGPGTGPGLPTYRQGQRGGHNQSQLTVLTMPSHNHGAAFTMPITSEDHAANGDDPTTGTGLLSTTDGAQIYGGLAENPAGKYGGGNLGVTVGMTGNNQAFDNMQPFLGMHYIIAIQGTFPSRN